MVLAGNQPLLVMTRLIDAPRAVVFEEWLRPERLARWWSPESRTPLLHVDARPDQAFRFRRRQPGAPIRWITVALCEIVRPERIVFTWGGEAADTATTVTVTFAELGARTQLALRQVVGKR